MKPLITGIHHITAIAGNPQKNIDFYTGILGLRMVKKTVNFDASGVYHFYFGDKTGSPGTILTFFPFDGARRGQKGTGEVSYTAFSIPINAVSYWQERLTKYGIIISAPIQRMGETVIRFEDHDGTGIELVANDTDNRDSWTYGAIPKQYAIRGFHSATLWLKSKTATEKLLTGLMDYQLVQQDGNRYRYATKGEPGDIVDIVENPETGYGKQSAGSVHHIAFRTANEDSQLAAQELLMKNGLHVTEVKDRHYFKSIYFREPGGILFEIATDEPGFAIDEEVEHLGKALKLPSWAEPDRAEIENSLPEVKLNTENYG